MNATHPEPAPESGFTLVEVLVALAIAAIGMAFFLSATGVGLNNTSIADQSIEATRLAQSHLAQVGLAMPLKPGAYSGDDGRGFRWRVEIAAPLTHARSAEGQSSTTGLYPIEVGESWQSGFTRREVVLHSERTGPL